MRKETQITFIPIDEKPFYLVTCRGGVTKTYQKDLALELAKNKEDKKQQVRIYESIKVQNGYETLVCIYFTGCGKEIVKV